MSRFRTPLAALPCRISRSAFPDERVFQVRTADGKEHAGSGPAYYFWNAENHPLHAGVPESDREIRGFVATQILKIDAARALVEVPDGTVAWVFEKDLVARPTEIEIDVPVRS